MQRPAGPPSARRRGRSLAVTAIVVVVAVVAVAAVVALTRAGTDRPPPSEAPYPEPTVERAPPAAATWRERAERWTVEIAPALTGRSITTPETWGDHLVRSTPLDTAVEMAQSAQGSRHAVARAVDRYGVQVAPAEQDRLAAGLEGGDREDDVVAAIVSDPQRRRLLGTDAAWVDALHEDLLGRVADPAGRDRLLGRLDAGEDHREVALDLARSTEARHHLVHQLHRELGRSRPSGDRLRGDVERAADTHGDTRRLRAAITTRHRPAPGPLGVGVVGDSLAFELVFRLDPTVRIGPVLAPEGANRLGCGVLSAVGYEYPRQSGEWGPAADGNCQTVIDTELDVAARSDVMVWVTGSWDSAEVRDPGSGVVVGAAGEEMRDLLAEEMVRRIDGWTDRGVRAVVLPEWGCLGPAARPLTSSAEYRSWHRSVIDAVGAQRPDVVHVAESTPMQCDDTGVITAEHATHRHPEDGTHRPTPEAVEWTWRHWYAGGVADAPTG